MAIQKHQIGHRSRLRERFLLGKLESVAEYELLEMILFSAFPRGDVKPLAKSLLKKFKSFSGVINASESELSQIKGMGTAAIASIKVIQSSSQILLKHKAEKGLQQSTLQQVIDYCKVTMENLRIEQLRLLFLDKKNQLILEEVQQEGTVDHTPIYTREVIKRALEVGASGIIIVHNHPSGDPTPSQSDIVATRDIKSASEKLDIKILDHIIIGKGAYISFRHKGLL